MVTLVDPHGNFGSLDDPPAAARYTECRLTEAAMEMVREIEEETVDFRPTYDGESTEPLYLPGFFQICGKWNDRYSCWNGNEYAYP